MPNSIRVLIVDDRPNTVENLRKLLMFEEDMDVVGTAVDGMAAIEQSHGLRPDVVLMDINMPRMDGLTATQRLTEELPGVAIIVMSIQGDIDYLRRAMQSGASEFLVKPFTADELVTTVRRAAQVAQRRGAMLQLAPAEAALPKDEAGKLVVVLSAKGGVGVTLLAINLATLLSDDEARAVSLVDLDLQFGDVGVDLNLEGPENIISWAERIDEELDDDFLDSILSQGPNRVKVLLAPFKPELAELVDGDRVKRILGEMRRRFDYVVVDGGKGLSEQTLEAIDAAEKLVVVGDSSLAGIKDTLQLLRTLETLGHGPERVLTAISGHGVQLNKSLAEIEATLRTKIQAKLPAVTDLVAKSLEKGVPMVTLQPNSEFSKAVKALVAEICPPLDDDSEPESGGRRFGLKLGR